MAIVTQPTPAVPSPPERALPPGAGPEAPIHLFRRPTGYTKGVWGWVTTVDHKKIGILYGVTAFIFFIIGGVEALLLRVQLGSP